MLLVRGLWERRDRTEAENIAWLPVNNCIASARIVFFDYVDDVKFF